LRFSLTIWLLVFNTAFCPDYRTSSEKDVERNFEEKGFPSTALEIYEKLSQTQDSLNLRYSTLPLH
jgi:hypothetical protein